MVRAKSLARSASLVGMALSLWWPVTVNGQDSPSDEAEIRRLVSEMTDRFNHHDAAAYMRLYTPDADFVSARGEETSLRVFVKNDGRWQVTAFQNTLVAPLTATSTR
ncbi:hypothetical protein [Microvirga massiliensis]|uniref:hypothetical protein n=1 Tax=Microvirga massiliensis TaxID=1033741 RepID=UPI00062B3311|nr:hypothetical protein [Microvirga massiliensis]